MTKIGIQYIYCCRDTEYRICEVTIGLDEKILNLLESYSNGLDLEYDGNPFLPLLKENGIVSCIKTTYYQCEYKLTQTFC